MRVVLLLCLIVLSRASERENIKYFENDIDFTQLKMTSENYDIFSRQDPAPCVTHPSMSMAELSSDLLKYKYHLKSVNGTQIYIGPQQQEGFRTLGFTYGDGNRIYCGVPETCEHGYLSALQCLIILLL